MKTHRALEMRLFHLQSSKDSQPLQLYVAFSLSRLIDRVWYIGELVLQEVAGMVVEINAGSGIEHATTAEPRNWKILAQNLGEHSEGQVSRQLQI